MASVAASTSSSAWSRLTSVPSRYPFAFGVIFSACKTSFSDLLVQTVVERKEKIDWKRNAAFAAFGFIYLGGVQYTIYVPLFGRMFPGAASFAAKSIRDKLKDTRGMFSLGAQVVIDQVVHHPFMYFPAFYCTKELVMHKDPDLSRAIGDYRKNMKEDLVALWKVWVPATILNFAFMPMYARIPFVAGVSLMWTCILSTMRGGDIAHGEDMAGGAVTGATLTMMKEGLGSLFTSPLELDRDMSHIMITASGHDKPGWVALLSRAVADGGGNVTHSKMVRLGNEFIIQMHVAVRPEEHRQLIDLLRGQHALKKLSLNCNTITRRNTGTYEVPVVGVRVRCVGGDKPGMLASISEKILDEGLSIENVTTELQRGLGGRKEFVVTADCVTTSYMNEERILALTSELGSLKEALELSVVDVRVQRLLPHKED